MPKKTKPLKQKAKKKQPQRQKQSVNIKVNIDQSRRSNPRQASQASQGQRRGPFNAKSPVMSHVPLLTQIMPATGTGTTTTTKNDDGVLKTTLDEVFKSRDQINDLTRRYADQSRYFHDLLDNQPHFDPEAQRHQLKLLLNEPEQQADIWNSIASSAKRLINYNLPQYSDNPNPPPAFQEAGPSGPGLVPPSRVRFDDEASQPPPEPQEQPPVPEAFQAPAEVVQGGAEALQGGAPAQPEVADAEPAQPEAQEEDPDYKPYKPITTRQRSYKNYINFAMDNNMVNRTPELDNDFEEYKKIVAKKVPTRADIIIKKKFENEFKGALKSEKAKADYDKVPARARK